MNNQVKHLIFITTAIIFIFGMYLPVRKPNLFPSYGKNHEARLANIKTNKDAPVSNKDAVDSQAANTSNSTVNETSSLQKNREDSNFATQSVEHNNSGAEKQQDSKQNETQENGKAENNSHIKKIDLTKDIKEDDIILGDENAPVVLIEYSSYTCPHCSEFHGRTFDYIKQNYIDTGKVKYILREFPSDYQAFDAAILARCADKAEFYKFADILYKRQENWAFKNNYRDILTNIASIGGLDSEEFKACLNNKELKSKILQNYKEANFELNLQGTPVFFINGKRIEGAAPYRYMKETLDLTLNSLNNSSER
jgi:protein-disulfide isomerase